MYIAAFLTVMLLLHWRIKYDPNDVFPNISKTRQHELLSSLILTLIAGLLIGARLGYVLFYNQSLLGHPLEIISPIQNGRLTGLYGMSYHGGLIGAIISGSWFVRRHRLNIWEISNFLIPAVPLGYTWGRLGNFLNGELYGKQTASIFGMYFPNGSTAVLRHPNQLYEAFFEGILIFIILWPLRNNQKIKQHLLPLYLILYGAARFLLEFVRSNESYFFAALSTAQILSLLMILSGITLILYIKNKKTSTFKTTI